MLYQSRGATSPKAYLLTLQWHPTRPVVASVANSGDIHIWQTRNPDNWAAFAAGFEELEENVEYDEREDEFDIVGTSGQRGSRCGCRIRNDGS